MNIKVINNYLKEISIPDSDLQVINSYFSRMDSLFIDEEFSLLPTDQLNIGLLFWGNGLKENNSIVYKIENKYIELKDSNLFLGNFLKSEYKDNYTSFTNFTKDMLEIKPHFLKQHVSINFFTLYIGDTIENSYIKIYYYKRLTDKDIFLSIPLSTVINGKKDEYRNIILTSLYNEYKSQFEEYFIVEDFVDYAEDVFLQNTMIDY